jgi:methyl-accepting chemotaxis protein
MPNLMKKKSKSTKRVIWSAQHLAWKSRENEKADWEYNQTTSNQLAKLGKKERRDLFMRTVRKVIERSRATSEVLFGPLTFSEIAKFRYDWIVPDEFAQFGTDNSINFTISNIKSKLNDMDAKLEEMGFKSPGLADMVTEMDRRTDSQITLFDRLKEIEGLELKE